MKIDPHYQRRRCSPMTLDSGNIRIMRIFAVVLKIYVNFPYIYICLRVSIYKERHGIPYSLSSSRRWFVTLSYQLGCREYASIGVTSGDGEAE